MKTLISLVLLSCIAMAQTPTKPVKTPASPTPYPATAEAKAAVLSATVDTLQAQVNVLSDQKYTTLMNAMSVQADKTTAACPAQGAQKYQLNRSTFMCEPVK